MCNRGRKAQREAAGFADTWGQREDAVPPAEVCTQTNCMSGKEKSGVELASGAVPGNKTALPAAGCWGRVQDSRNKDCRTSSRRGNENQRRSTGNTVAPRRSSGASRRRRILRDGAAGLARAAAGSRAPCSPLPAASPREISRLRRNQRGLTGAAGRKDSTPFLAFDQQTTPGAASRRRRRRR